MRTIILFGATVTSLILAEICLRIVGFTPWSERPQHPFLSPSHVVFVPDPIRGWRNRPGRYDFTRIDGKAIVNTNLSDGSRYSGKGRGRPVVFVGGSYTYGWEIDDGETFAALVQKKLPDRSVRNFGTGGYGAYQSFLSMQQVVGAATFVYGFGDFHQPRDVAREDWLRAMSIQSARADSRLYMPYVSLRNGNLVQHAPEPYGDWPLKRYFAFVALAEHAYFRWKLSDRDAYREQPTMEVIRAMKQEAGDRRFIVAMLMTIAQPGNRERYIKFFKSVGIEYVDCTVTFEPQMRVDGRGHPNEDTHRYWAKCISEAIAPSSQK